MLYNHSTNHKVPTKSRESAQGLTLPKVHDLNGMPNFIEKYFGKWSLKLYARYLGVWVFVCLFSGRAAEPAGILVPQPGIEPGHTAVKAPGPNHWTARDSLGVWLSSC